MSPAAAARVTLRAMRPFTCPLAAGLLVGLLASCSQSAPPVRSADQGKTRDVIVAAVARQPMERTVTATGSFLAQDQATLAIKVPGRLITLAVDLGGKVKQGDVLAQVDPQDYELRQKQALAGVAQARAAMGLPLDGTNDVLEIESSSLVRQAKAVLDEATKNRERITNLSQAGIAPASEVDTAQAAYLVALNRYEASLDEARTRQAALTQRRAELDLAQKQLSDTRLRAPYDGAVQARLANLGEFLSAGSPVLVLVRADPLRLRLEVSERHAGAIRTGQVLRVRVEGHPNAVTGQIARVSPAITEQNRMLIVEADIANDGALRPGLFARAEIVTQENEPGLAIPTAALIVFAGIEKVVTVQDGKAREKTLITGRRGDGWVEILTGLKAGELVVLEPGSLRTGQPVRATEAQRTTRVSESSGP